MKIPAKILLDIGHTFILAKADREGLGRETVLNYKLGMTHFISWYESKLEDFDSTWALAAEWLRRSKSVKDNANNYSVVGHIVLQIVYFLDTLTMLGIPVEDIFTKIKHRNCCPSPPASCGGGTTLFSQGGDGSNRGRDN